MSVDYEYYLRHLDESAFYEEIGGDPTFERFTGCHCNMSVIDDEVRAEVWFDHTELGNEDAGEYMHTFVFDRVFFKQFHTEAMAMVEKWAHEWATHLKAVYAAPTQPELFDGRTE